MKWLLARIGLPKAIGVYVDEDTITLSQIVATPLGIFLYDAKTMEEVTFIETETDLRQMVFSPDGKVLALAGEGTLQLWSISDASLLHTLEGHTNRVECIDSKSKRGQRGPNTRRKGTRCPRQARQRTRWRAAGPWLPR